MDLLKRLDAHIAMMAPHQRDREAGRLLIECREAVKQRDDLLAALENVMDRLVDRHECDEAAISARAAIAAANNRNQTT